MSTLVIRKPKFMRNDIAMNQHIDIAAVVANEMNRPNLTIEQRYELSTMISECLDNASKAGGFFRTEDFCRWMNKRLTKKKGSA